MKKPPTKKKTTPNTKRKPKPARQTQRAEYIELSNTKTPQELRIEAEACIMALWYQSGFTAKDAIKKGEANIALLEIALSACGWLNVMSSEFAPIGPQLIGWPVVLSAAKEREHEWGVAEEKITHLKIGTKHPKRFELAITGWFADFVNGMLACAVAERDNMKLGGMVTSADIPKLINSAKENLERYYGEEYQDHEDVSYMFRGRYFSIRGENRKWESMSWKQKRETVRSKIEKTAKTFRAKLSRFAKSE